MNNEIQMLKLERNLLADKIHEFTQMKPIFTHESVRTASHNIVLHTWWKTAKHLFKLLEKGESIHNGVLVGKYFIARKQAQSWEFIPRHDVKDPAYKNIHHKPICRITERKFMDFAGLIKQYNMISYEIRELTRYVNQAA